MFCKCGAILRFLARKIKQIKTEKIGTQNFRAKIETFARFTHFQKKILQFDNDFDHF